MLELGFLVRVRRAGESTTCSTSGKPVTPSGRLRRFFLRVKAEFSRSSALVDIDPGRVARASPWSVVARSAHRTTEGAGVGLRGRRRRFAWRLGWRSGRTRRGPDSG
ncbi:MAG: hypothetical protein R2705_16045 [Ilumatobacteraceae bacterium]